MRFSFFICFLLYFNIEAKSQGLCATSGVYTSGGFNLSSDEICVGKAVSMIDISGASEVKYVYDYKGESIELARGNATANISRIYPAPAPISGNFNPYQVTILQIGNLNGKTSIACKKLTVRPSEQPVLSWNICSSGTAVNRMELSIPNNPLLNDHDFYTIDLGAPNPLITVSKAQLPYTNNTISFPSLPRTIRVTGSYTLKTPTCGTTSNIVIALARATIPADRPFSANIDRIELVDLNNAKLNISGSPTPSINNQYTLFGYPVGTFTTNPKPIVKVNISPGEISIPIPDPVKSYCFYMQRNTLCNTLERSAEICTHPLLTISAPANSTNIDLTWNRYPVNTLFGAPALDPRGNRISSTQVIKRFQSNPALRTTQVIPGSQSTRSDATADCSKNNCYQIEIQNTGTLFVPANQIFKFSGVSISNVLCIDRSSIVPPGIDQLYVTTNTDKERFQIEFTPSNTWKVPIKNWDLYQIDGGNSTKLNSTGPNNNFILDNRLPKGSTAYKVGFTDMCNSVSTLSPKVHSVFLGHSRPNTLLWSMASPFVDPKVKEYEIIPLNEANNSIEIAASKFKVDKNTFKTQVDISKYIDFAPFYLKIYYDGTPAYNVNSNITKIPITPNFYVPTVFTPNGDGPNELLEVKGQFNKVDSFQWRIYDRFGGLVFETDDPTIKWDGTRNGKTMEAGVYSWKLVVVLKNQEIITKTGRVLLMRT